MAENLVTADGKMRITSAGATGALRRVRLDAHGIMISLLEAAEIADFSQRRSVLAAVDIIGSF
jgi:hypothetical protein